MKYPKITLGTWSWGAGMAGGDQVFGVHTDDKMLRPVFETDAEVVNSLSFREIENQTVQMPYISHF